MKVRVIELAGYEQYDNYGDDCRFVYSLSDITSWEEANEEELQALNLWAIEYNGKQYNSKVIVVSEKELNYKKTIADYLEKAKKIKKEIEEREKKEKEKQESKQKKALESKVRKAEKEKEKKLKLYETLKQEFGV